MAVIYAAAVRTARMNAVLTAIDQDVGAGKLQILTSADVLLAELPLSDPAGSVSGDVLTFAAITTDTSANNSGTASKAQITDNSGDAIITGLTVGTSGANINLSSVSITAGQQVAITSATLTHNTAG